LFSTKKLSVEKAKKMINTQKNPTLNFLGSNINLNAEMQNKFIFMLLGSIPKWISKFTIIRNEITLEVDSQNLFKILLFLKNYTGTQYKVLIDITAVDYPKRKNRFEVVYILLGIQYNTRIIIKTSLDQYTPIDSVVGIFPAANWFERETWDMFGIFFINHPDLRRILTDYGFDGYPLRKDFPLSGFFEVRYNDIKKRVVSEPIQFTQEFRFFDFASPWEFLKKESN
jgi:NADH dehydrogenase (ubiquinone) Fe-S protein 3